MNAKQQAVLERLQHIEEAIAKGREYLATGQHANWQKFQPLFHAKVREGQRLPPHKDWVQNVFLPEPNGR